MTAGGEVGLLRWIAGVAALLLGTWLLLVVITGVFQRQLIYLPDRSEPSPPDDVQPVSLTTADDLELTAWFLAVEDPASTIVVLPGNAGNRAGRLPMARELVARGHQVLLVDYRGYGGNPGQPSQEGLTRDARAAREYIGGRDDVDPDRIVYLGESIGSGVAAALAAEQRPAAVVLRSPFPELADVGRVAYPILPVSTLLRDRYPVVEHLVDADVPVLVVAGTRDRIVPPSLSIEVAESLDAQLLKVEGAGHNDRALFTGARYLDTVDRFIRQH